jgi:hypothetical protein
MNKVWVLFSGHIGDDEFMYSTKEKCLSAFDEWIEGGRLLATEYDCGTPEKWEQKTLDELYQAALSNEFDDGIHVAKVTKEDFKSWEDNYQRAKILIKGMDEDAGEYFNE